MERNNNLPQPNIFKNNVPKDTENKAESQVENTDIPLTAFQQDFKEFEETLANDNSINTKDSSTKKKFDSAIYEALPQLLKRGCDILTDTSEKEVFLVGALGVVSGILPNVQGAYDGKFYGPHLYCYILARYGTGKGGLHFCKQLAYPIHQRKKEQFVEEQTAHEAKLIAYDMELKQYKKNGGTLPEQPAEAKQKLLFIPANNSKTGLFELLANNNERGIIFETEGDTIADAIKQDYGNYSDGFRKAFHHETISYFRRTGNEYVEILKPELAVVLSSTYDQLLNLIPNIQNGLFSRFLFYQLDGTSEFKNVFSKQKSNYPERFAELSKEFTEVHDSLNSLDHSLIIELTNEQQEKFLSTFRTWKNELGEYLNNDLDGTVNRLGLICFRLCVIFTTLRQFEHDQLFEKVLICQDVDFDNALKIVSVLKHQAISIYFQLPNPDKRVLKKGNPKKEKAIALRKDGMSYREIGKKLRASHSTIFGWCNS
ncbi:MAG: DUF3987 domain-containing protein [Bacteroidota bacterium]